MPQCSDCHCDLPGFETLCSKCLEARYSALGHPKSVLESMRLFVSNPFGITLESKSKMGRRGAIACSCGGVLLCWLGGSKVAYKCPLFSDTVLYGAFQLSCEIRQPVAWLVTFFGQEESETVLGSRFERVLGNFFMLRAFVWARRRFSRCRLFVAADRRDCSINALSGFASAALDRVAGWLLKIPFHSATVS
jgi:hypothetical protein